MTLMSGWERIQDCRDALGRVREGAHGLRLFIDGNRIGLHTPPGEVATLSVVEAFVLQQNLGAALLEAGRRVPDGLPVRDTHYRRVHDLLDLNNQTRRVQVIAVDGEVHLSVVDPCKAPTPAIADEVGYSVLSASGVAGFQLRQAGRS